MKRIVLLVLFINALRCAATKNSLIKPDEYMTASRPDRAVASLESHESENVEQGLSYYKSLFLLIISLMHGTLFFTVLERLTITAPWELGLGDILTHLLYAVVYLRVFQSQVSAAIKYDRLWQFSLSDFILVFGAVSFEYLLFNSRKVYWIGSDGELILILVFAIFASVSYLMSYLRVRSGLNTKTKRSEMRIQISNVAAMVLVGTIALTLYAFPLERLDIVGRLLIVFVVTVNLIDSSKNLVSHIRQLTKVNDLFSLCCRGCRHWLSRTLIKWYLETVIVRRDVMGY